MATSSGGSSSSYYSSNSPCAACKFLRRKCLPGCLFAPYFPPEEPQKFANVHRIFGASNVSKILNEIEPHQREDAVNSLAYEAEARLKDPVYGCVGAISVLQRQVLRLQKELDATNADLMRYASGSSTSTITTHHEIHSRYSYPPAAAVNDQLMDGGGRMMITRSKMNINNNQVTGSNSLAAIQNYEYDPINSTHHDYNHNMASISWDINSFSGDKAGDI